MPANVPGGLLAPGFSTAVATSPLALPQTGTSSLFIVTGTCRILQLYGIVTTVIGAVANATKLQFICTAPALTAVDLCATADINALAAGAIYSITGTLATLATIVAPNTNGLALAQATGLNVTTGIIRVNTAGSDGGTGRIQWFIDYMPMNLATPTNLTPLIPTSNIVAAG